MTHDELAHRAVVSTVTVSRVERGVTQAKPATLRRLAKALGLPEGEILVAAGDGHQPKRLLEEVATTADLIRVDVLEVLVRLERLETVVAPRAAARKGSRR